MSKFIIQDWIGRRIYPENKFDTFEEARKFIQDEADVMSVTAYPLENDKRLELYDSLINDMYVVMV